jgi:hypothetical protein
MTPRHAFAMRVGVVLCVGMAFAAAALKWSTTLLIYAGRADANSSYTYSQRAHTHPEWSPEGGRVLEDARLWMPEDARYRVVLGPEFDPETSSDFTRYLLLEFLLPRRPTTSSSAPWVFCYGCTSATLGRRFEILSQAGGGPTFGRMRP